MARNMKLLTKEIEKKLPALYSTEGTPTKDKMVIAKFFNPYTSPRWRWLAVEYDPVDRVFFGYVEGTDQEWGYFSLDEFENTMVMRGLRAVERDMYFSPKKFSECVDSEGHIR